MNLVFMSGMIQSPITVVSKEDEALHVKATLSVAHITSKGVRKEELFTVNAWRGTAQRMMELARKGSRMAIQGYLSCAQTEEGLKQEVTVREFQVSGSACCRQQGQLENAEKTT